MAAVKQEYKYQFEEGAVWVLMDADWGVSIVAEEHDDGNLVDMGTWEFKTREAWEDWGGIVNERLQQIQSEGLSPDETVNAIYAIDNLMPEDIKEQQI